jgi:hypothetical protein
MTYRAVTALSETLRGHVELGKSRLETLCLLVVGMVHARTVSLGHIATLGSGRVLTASTYRRLQRFFQHVRLAEDWALPLVAKQLGSEGPWYLALDRTQWKVGREDVNYLVLAAVTKRFRVPLAWTVLDKQGNSGTKERIDLLRRYLAHFPASTIRCLLADREFVGADWLKFLNDNNIPFAIRLRENLHVTDEDGHDLGLLARLHRARRTKTFRARLGTRDDAETRDAPLLNFAAKRLEGEWLIVVSNIPARRALDAYRKRWGIECLFGDAKTRGLNLEDTRLTDPRKLHLLMGLVALAIAWAGRTAVAFLGRRQPMRKAHGYLAQSFFRIGFDRIRALLTSDPLAAIQVWRTPPSSRPNHLQTQRVV